MSNEMNNSINRILESVDGIAKASPKPFLLTRINAGIKNVPTDTVWSQIAFYLKKPMVAAFAIVLVLLVNFIVISNRNKWMERDSITKSITPQKYDFAINVSVMYDIENQEP